jgi:hypothetical protein
MTSKFEQLIEYVINDEEAKAKELFHDIVVEKSREIYENLMNEESDAEEDDKAEKAGKKVAKDIEYDDKKDRTDEAEEEEEESIEEDMGDTSGDASQDLMREVETEEEGMHEDEEEESSADFDDEAEEEGEDLTHDIEADHDAEEGDIEDRVVDLEDKLDELMAEFEALMGDEAAEHGDDGFDMEPVDGEVGGDAYMDDDTSEFQDMPMSEDVSLAKVPNPTHGDNGANPKSPVAANSGAAGMAAKPVRNTATEANPDGTSAYKAPTSYADKGRGDLPGAGKFKNVPAKDGSKLEAAPKPTLSQATGVNTKTPFPKG